MTVIITGQPIFPLNKYCVGPRTYTRNTMCDFQIVSATYRMVLKYFSMPMKKKIQSFRKMKALFIGHKIDY